MKKLINTEEFSSHLREKGINIDSKKILLTKFVHSEQEKDLTLPPNCGGFGRIHHFRRLNSEIFPMNPLPIDPAQNYLRQEYADEIKVQVFQNAFCSWRCWYCFVDYKLLSANSKYSEFQSVEEQLDLYLKEEIRSPIIDLSGGQPDLVPEWGLWMLDEIHKRGLSKDIYVWSDDNLSNEYLWDYLTDEERDRFAKYENYGRVGCFKGFDPESFSFNTGADPTLWDKQFQIMKRLIDVGFDMYGYVTLTSFNDINLNAKIIYFIDKLQEIDPIFPLRTIPLKIVEFTPTKSRMREDHFRAIDVQEKAIDIWNSEIQKRFTAEQRGKRIHEQILKRNAF